MPDRGGAAAFLCNLIETTPRGLYLKHLGRLKTFVHALTGHDHDLGNGNPKRKFVAVPG
jgi:hypothetical protein